MKSSRPALQNKTKPIICGDRRCISNSSLTRRAPRSRRVKIQSRTHTSYTTPDCSEMSSELRGLKREATTWARAHLADRYNARVQSIKNSNDSPVQQQQERGILGSRMFPRSFSHMTCREPALMMPRARVTSPQMAAGRARGCNGKSRQIDCRMKNNQRSFSWSWLLWLWLAAAAVVLHRTATGRRRAIILREVEGQMNFSQRLRG